MIPIKGTDQDSVANFRTLFYVKLYLADAHFGQQFLLNNYMTNKNRRTALKRVSCDYAEHHSACVMEQKSRVLLIFKNKGKMIAKFLF